MAVKRLTADSDNVDGLVRFIAEVQTIGQLEHPNIIPIHDVGLDQDGRYYFVMKYVDGETLESIINKLAAGDPDYHARYPFEVRVEMFLGLLHALQYAHDQGVVHRDIKPANVMVDTEGGSVKVMDFGVARVDDASRTRTGIVLGTPSFMSPEQMSGRRTDGRSDLYSLGVMLFQLLTGTLPFEGGSMAELMRRIVNEPAPDVRGLRPELPQALADVVALALEKRPEVRYADGVQMAQDLRAVAAAMLAPEPPQAVQEDAFEKTVTFARIEPRHNSAS